MNHLLDTSVLIAYSHQKAGAIGLLDGLARSGQDLATCAVVITEFYSGVRNDRERQAADRLFDRMVWLDLSREIAKEAGRLRREYAARGVALGVADVLLAALALAQDIPFVTGNAKDFPMPGLRLLEVSTR